MSTQSAVQKEINYTSLSHQVYQHIKRMIMTQELKGGQRIPEEAIAKLFGVSRTPIREAIRELEKNGLVRIYPRKYAEVVTLTKKDKRQIGTVRVHLDKLSVSILCRTLDKEGYETLSDISSRCEQYVAEGDLAGCFEMDSAFHCTMAELTGNVYLAEIVRVMDLKVQLLRNIGDLTPEHIHSGIIEHQTLADAIYSGDESKALALIEKHLKDYYFVPKTAI